MGSKEKECTCTDKQKEHYKSKLSGPLFDRFDIHVQVPSIDYKKLESGRGESSENIRERVNKARKIQLERFRNMEIFSNSELTPALIEKYCKIDNESNELLKNAFEKMNLTARAYSKILKVARTIADLDSSEDIKRIHLMEAIQYRSLDRI